MERLSCIGIPVVAAWLAAAAGVFAGCPDFGTPASIGTVATPALTEISGLAVSRDNEGVLWAHNDSGDAPRVFALTDAGTHLGAYTLSGAAAVDWEDMAIGPGPVPGVSYLYLGDIGDNGNGRSQIVVYRVPEPAVDPGQQPVTVTLEGVESITLVYPDGSRDAETLMVDTNGDLYLVSKRVTAQGRVYRASFPQSTTSTVTLEFVAQIPWGSSSGVAGATGGDIAPDGSAVVVRRYTIWNPQATLWLRPPGTDLGDVFAAAGCNVAIASEGQGEAIAFRPGSLTYLTVSEGSNQAIHEVVGPPLPCTGDVNGDGVVDVNDLVALFVAWGTADPAADVNDDGDVDVDDLNAVIIAWGSCP